MFGTIAVSAKAAAPFVGAAAVTGAKALTAFAISTKAGHYATDQAQEFLTNVSSANAVAKAKRRNYRDNRNTNVNRTQERKAPRQETPAEAAS